MKLHYTSLQGFFTQLVFRFLLYISYIPPKIQIGTVVILLGFVSFFNEAFEINAGV